MLMYLPTCLKFPLHSHTVGAALCRHIVVVGGVSSKPLREDGVCPLAQGGGSVSIDWVSVGWVCTIVNGAVVLLLKKKALHIDS